MLRLVADHNFEQAILDGLQERIEVDLVTARDFGLESTDDPDLLAWAAQEGRILLTHDRQTIPGFAYDRIRAGLPMPGVVVVRDKSAVGQSVDDLYILVVCSAKDDCRNQVQYLPWPD